jgi:two-component system CitB family response regulator
VTLDKTLEEMKKGPTMFTSEEMAERVGASRTTARRYLEYLVSRGGVEVDLSYGGEVGRPERIYRMTR